MPDRELARLRVAVIPVLCCLCGPVPWVTASETLPPASGDRSASPATSRTLTLDAYVEMKKAAGEALEAPEGPERIARCEAFVKAHPDYPDLRHVLWALIEDSVKAGGFDPAAIATRIENLVSLSAGREVLLQEPDLFIGDPAFQVDQYYFRYGLPLESAQRLIDIGWRRMAQARGERRRGKGSVGGYQQEIEDALAEGESVLRLDEARVRLARGDAAGALQILQENDGGMRRDEGRILLRTRAGGKVSAIPLPRADWYELTLARAYATLGKQPQALEHLERVMAFGEIPPDLRDALARLRSELGRPARHGQEFRGEPVRAPEFVLKDLDGRDSRLSDFRGRVVLLVFWTTW